MWTTPNYCSITDDRQEGRSACSGRAVEGEARIPEPVYLKPGGVFAGSSAARVTTVLGSCVAVTMYDPKSRAAAMCHATQPVCTLISPSCSVNCTEKYRNVRCAVDEMIRRMKKMGAFHDDLELKIFGGAALFEEPNGRGMKETVGQQNIKAARRILVGYGFRIRVMQVGGGVGRKIIFDTTNGAVFLKRIKSICANEPTSVRATPGRKP